MNSNSTTLAFLGNNFQRVHFLNNVIAKNFALFYDTALIRGMSANITRNLFSENTGLHTMDTQGISRISSDAQIFVENFFVNNRALGEINMIFIINSHSCSINTKFSLSFLDTKVCSSRNYKGEST